jgi:hypothetical protein
MNFPKKYFQDKLVLLLLSANAFLTVLVLVLIALRIGSGHTDYLVQCRDCSNIQAVGRFTKGSLSDILAFMVYAAMVMAVHTLLSIRLYRVHRQLAVIILALGTLLLVIAMIVSNALLLSLR